MNNIKSIVTDFFSEHCNELFSTRLREQLQNRLYEEFVRCMSDNNPLEKMELQLNNHIETRIDDRHIFVIDICVESKLVGFNIVERST